MRYVPKENTCCRISTLHNGIQTSFVFHLIEIYRVKNRLNHAWRKQQMYFFIIHEYLFYDDKRGSVSASYVTVLAHRI